MQLPLLTGIWRVADTTRGNRAVSRVPAERCMFFLIRSGFWLGLVFCAIGEAPVAGIEPGAMAVAAASVVAVCAKHAKTCAAPLAAIAAPAAASAVAKTSQRSRPTPPRA